MIGIGCSELADTGVDKVGGLQSVFDVQQATNIATFVHKGSVDFSMIIFSCVELLMGWLALSI